MSYQVLARKWRPDSFDSLVGQAHVVRALTNALDQQRLHHAYLFTGTRGVGKTTLGRILAKCFNCETGITSKPCNTCSPCKDIAAGRFLDLIEVDAASRTKVEDTRELLENLAYAPTSGRFKVYLIDEVHMLSTHSFNALLKTLEEPPPHVKFILATTDPQKLPVTVLSRCLQFHLKALSSEQISKQLADILQSEKMPFEPEALTRLAYAAEGSMRDALSLLDQAIAYSNSQVTTVAIKSMLSTIEATFIYDILEALVTQQAEKLIQITQNLAEQSLDFANTLEELLSLLHQIAIKQHAASIEIGSWDSDKIAHFAGRLAPQDVQLFYQIALIGRRDLPLAPTARIGLEMVLLRMLAFQPKTADLSLLAQTKSLEPVVKSRDTGGLGQSITPDLALSAQTKSLESTPRSGDVVDLSQSTAVSTPSSVSAPLASSWSEIVRHLNLTGMTAAIAAHCVLEKLSDDEIVIAIDPAQRILLNKKQEERLTQALQAYFKKPLCLTVITGPTNMETPAVKAQQKQSQQKSQALDAMHQDQNVQNIIATFNAQILPNSVTIGDKDSSD